MQNTLDELSFTACTHHGGRHYFQQAVYFPAARHQNKTSILRKQTHTHTHSPTKQLPRETSADRSSLGRDRVIQFHSAETPLLLSFYEIFFEINHQAPAGTRAQYGCLETCPEPAAGLELPVLSRYHAAFTSVFFDGLTRTPPLIRLHNARPQISVSVSLYLPAPGSDASEDLFNSSAQNGQVRITATTATTA